MMNEWIISSSLLIAAVLLGRRLLRGKISLRLQYALWAVVLIRLLLPVQLFTSDFGAGSIAQDVDISEPVRQVYTSAREDDYEREYDTAYRQVVAEYEAYQLNYDPIVVEQEAQTRAQESLELDLNKLLWGAWFAGMVVMTSVIVSCNVHLGLHLKRRRWELPVSDSLLPVYVTEAVPTPCIFGLFRPAIYLTPEAAGDETIRRHVLTHELTHYRHGDHLWSVLRSVCLILHWYNPLVWMAAKVSRADAELACDEGALTKLGEAQRGDYGRTLIGLTCPDNGTSLFVTATTMTGSAGSIRERIKLLMKRPRNTVLALIAVILVGAIVVGCSFAGAPETTEPTETTQPTEPVETQPEFGSVEYFDDLLNPDLHRSEADWYPRALTSYYDSPIGIDLFQLFYGGIPGADNSITPEEQAFLEKEGTYEPDFDLVRIPGAEMNRVLTEYFGIIMASTTRMGLYNFTYNPDTDCYYHCHTDSNLSFRAVYDAQELSNGNWSVLYSSELGDGEVILRQRDGKWQIVSHLPIEETPLDLDAQAAEAAALFGDPWYQSALTVLYSAPYDFDAETFLVNGQDGVALTDAAERALISDTYGKDALNQPVIRLTEGQMERILQTYIGVGTWDVDLSGFLYCPETEMYLMPKEENNDPMTPEILDCVSLEENQVRMIYKLPASAPRCATLLKGETWKVYSNQLIISAPEDARPLTAEEIEQVSAAFVPAIVDEETGAGIGNPLACIVNDYYDDVTKLDRSAFLRNYPYCTDGTEEEFRLLKAKYPDFFGDWEWDTMPIPIHCYDPKDLNKTLQTYADIRWEDLSWDDGLHYLEETGCFYNYTSDFGLMGFHCTGGWVYDGGAVLISDKTALYLTERNGDYFISAHLPAIVAQASAAAHTTPEEEIADTLEAFFLAYEENLNLTTDHDYDHLTILAADPARTVTYQGKTVPLSDFHGNIEYLHGKEAYWKHVRKDADIVESTFQVTTNVYDIRYDGDVAIVEVGINLTFYYEGLGAPSGMGESYEVRMVFVDDTWLIADITELNEWFDEEYKNNPDFDPDALIAAHIP